MAVPSIGKEGTVMGPYYDYITMLALGFTPPPPGSARLQEPGPTIGVASALRRVWDWIKPRRRGLLSAPSAWDRESLRRDPPVNLNPLMR